MEIETQNTHSLFTPLTIGAIHDLQTQSVICQLQISFQKFHTHTHKLILTKTHILLTSISLSQTSQQQTPVVYATPLEFELKFQIELMAPDHPNSQKIGITLFRSSQITNTFYTFHEPALQALRKNLSRFINQKGFHSQFKPVKKLGKGNFASVYQVVRLEDMKKFAVKAFSKANTYNSENGKESLINELSIMRELSHQSDNLLCLEAVYESDNSIYIVLELLEGKNLYQIMKEKNGSFTLEEVRVIMKGLLQGIKCMEEKKIMHRDLKPENIMFRAQNLTTPQTYEPVIVDFGLAARSDKVPYLFFRCGTPGFVAPQIITIQQNEQYSPACDMFSVGCIFHLLMTNSPVFTGTKYEQVYKKNKFLEFSIKQPIINQLNQYALPLLEQMLESSPQLRLAASNALNSEFFIPSISQKMDHDETATNYPISPKSTNYKNITL